MPQQSLVNTQTGERFMFAHASKQISKDAAYSMLQRHGKPTQANQLPDGTAIIRQSQPNPQQAQALKQRFQQAHEQVMQQLRGAYQQGKPVLQALDDVLRDVVRLGEADAGSQAQQQAFTSLLHCLSTSRDRMLGIGTDGVPVGTAEAQIVYALAHDPTFIRSAAQQREVDPQRGSLEQQVAGCWKRVARLSDISRALSLAMGRQVEIGSQAMQLWMRGIMQLLQLKVQAEFVPQVMPMVQPLLQMVAQTGMALVGRLSYETPDQVRTGKEASPGMSMPAPMNMQAMRGLRL